MYGRPLPPDDHKWGKKHKLQAIFITMLFVVPVWLEYHIGGFGKFPLSVTRLIHGTSIGEDLTKKEVEARLLKILTRENNHHRFRSSRESAYFDGCVLVRRAERSKSQCGPNRWWRTDRRINLKYLRTDPKDVELAWVSEDLRSSFVGRLVIYDYQGDLWQRLGGLKFLSNGIVSSEYIKHDEDEALRRRNISRRHDQVLLDKAYLDAGATEHWCVGEKTHSPTRDSVRYRFHIDWDSTEEFVDLIHLYRQNHCSAAVGG